MIEARLAELAAVVETRLIKGDVAFAGVTTDSRHVRPGELFVALRGERHDAHDYVAQARSRAAPRPRWSSASSPLALPQLVVPRHAGGARAHRAPLARPRPSARASASPARTARPR